METLGLFPKFADAIKALPPGDIRDEDLPPFLLQQHGRISIYYAPFDWINPDARVVIVGITPGRSSMAAAFRAARTALLDGKSLADAAMIAKRTGSFSNMRHRIGGMLDEIGLNDVLGVDQCAQLFGDDGSHRHLVHATSCVRYPVFAFNKRKQKAVNYSGSSPQLARCPLFQPYIRGMLAAELRQMPNAIVVPCGERVSEALALLDDDLQRRCLIGFPHASGQNGHRGRIWAREKDQLRQRVRDFAKLS